MLRFFYYNAAVRDFLFYSLSLSSLLSCLSSSPKVSPVGNDDETTNHNTTNDDEDDDRHENNDESDDEQ